MKNQLVINTEPRAASAIAEAVGDGEAHIHLRRGKLSVEMSSSSPAFPAILSSLNGIPFEIKNAGAPAAQVSRGSKTSTKKRVQNVHKRIDGMNLGEAVLKFVTDKGGHATRKDIQSFAKKHGYQVNSCDTLLWRLSTERAGNKAQLRRDGSLFSLPA